MAATEIGRPIPRLLGFGEILSESYEFYREHFPILFGVSIIGMIPMAIPQTLMHFGQVGRTPQTQLPMLVGGYLTLIVSLIIMTIGTGALTRAACCIYERQRTGAGSAYGFILKRLISYWVTLFFAGLLHMTGLCGCGIGVFATWVFFNAIIYPIFCTEGEVHFAGPWWNPIRVLRGMVNCITRNFELVRSQWLVVLGVLFVASIIQSIIMQILNTPSQILQWVHIAVRAGTQSTPAWFDALLTFSFLWTTVVQALLFPYPILCQVLLYYDLRMRREAWDLELIATRLEQQAQEATRLAPPRAE